MIEIHHVIKALLMRLVVNLYQFHLLNNPLIGTDTSVSILI